MHSRYPIKIILLFCITFAISSLCQAAITDFKEEIDTLLLFYKKEDVVITPTRHLKPILRVAENVSVITAADIEMINAHTLKDVLNIVPGIQVDSRGGPGSASSAYIQGSDFAHVLVMIDGITLNNLSDNFADISAIPVQNIERVEIIKGPASSSWGSSLGGVINIITKQVTDSQGPGVELFGSFGEKNTRDYREEVSGRKETAGYYVYAGNLESDGLTANTPFEEESFYTKLWGASERGKLLFTLGYNEGARGMGEYTDMDMSFEYDFEHLFSSLSFDYEITSETDLHFSLRTSRIESENITNQLSTKEELAMKPLDESGYGISTQYSIEQYIHSLVFGMDLDRRKIKAEDDAGQEFALEQEKWAVFANDTLMIKRLSIIPGIRYDHTNTNGDFLSPSIGLTYQATTKNLLKGYIARGFNTPPLFSTYGPGSLLYIPNPDLDVEEVWSVQAGIESTALRYMWIKANLFYHNIRDAISKQEVLDPNGKSTGKSTAINLKKQRRQGFELEIKTVPFFNTSLFAGFFFVDAKDRLTGERLKNVPRYTYDIGIRYSNPKIFNAYINGHYIYWNTSLPDSEYHNFIWDFNIMKNFYWHEKTNVKVFLTVHNVFDSSQYLLSYFRNPQRWIEAGLKLEF